MNVFSMAEGFALVFDGKEDLTGTIEVLSSAIAYYIENDIEPPMVVLFFSEEEMSPEAGRTLAADLKERLRVTTEPSGDN